MRKKIDKIQKSIYKQDRVSVIIPTKNEEKSVGFIIDKVKKFASEIILIDGHSHDKTVLIAKEKGIKVIMDNKKGKGDAIRTAINYINNEITVFIDADQSHDPNDIPKLVDPIIKGKADHVTGSRLLGGSSELHGGFDECFRLMGSSFINACINWKFKVRLSDSQNGFRAIKTEVLKKLDLKENITTIEQEMIIKTLKKGFIMAEVPAHEYKRAYGSSKIKLKKVFIRYIYSMVKYLFFK